MTAVIVTIHVLIVLGLIVVVLLQRSEGGALGMGGGGGGGGFMTGRGAANALTRITSILAALFFTTSLGLAIYAGAGESADTVIEELTGEALPEAGSAPAGLSTDDLLNTIGGDTAAPEAEDAPLSEDEILDSLSAASDDAAAAVDDAAEEAPAESDEPNQ